ETFFGKQKGKSIDKKLNTLTIIVAIVFVVICLLLYIIQPGKGKTNYGDTDNIAGQVTEAVNDTVTTGTPEVTASPDAE
ncbi:MAG: hypothetical protein J5850_05295, partial [Clostridia bacterium]|nr:hypothetical protein [Clostridia bacterium]